MKLVRSNDIPWEPAVDRARYAGRRKALSPATNVKLAAGMWELPAGKLSWPLHVHHVTEEALYAVSGRATVRTPEGDTAIGPGDYVSFPPGGPAHQLVNEGTEPFVYVGLSVNTVGADIVEYPNSGKVGLGIGAGAERRRMMFRAKEQADYFEGEE